MSSTLLTWHETTTTYVFIDNHNLYVYNLMVTDLATLFEKILLTFYLYKIVSLFILK